jgi:hypothetical protein
VSVELKEPSAGRKPITDPGITEEHPLALAARIASRFRLPSPVEAHDFPERGNIHHHTFLIRAGRDRPREFLLQRINSAVFTRPRNVMAALLAASEAQRRAIARGLLPEGREWETIELIPTRDGRPYLEQDGCRGLAWWRLMVKIPGCRTYKSLGEIKDPRERLAVAEEAGRGLAIYEDLTSGMDISDLENPLPGYRDTRVYYAQLHSVLEERRTPEEAAPFLPADPVVRQSAEEHFLVHIDHDEYRRRVDDPRVRAAVDLALREEEFAMTLLREMDEGRIRRTAIHGDTKLDNFLFDARTNRAKAIVDLDTILPHTWLADWGDMVRSLANVSGERERDLAKVDVDMGIYEALARGFLGTAREVTPAEVERMVDAVEIIALELGIRFLTDHLRGDSYFKLGPADPADINRVRGLAQLALFEKLRARGGETRRLVRGLHRSP